jgi:hypothetical protein
MCVFAPSCAAAFLMKPKTISLSFGKEEMIEKREKIEKEIQENKKRGKNKNIFVSSSLINNQNLVSLKNPPSIEFQDINFFDVHKFFSSFFRFKHKIIF